MRPRHAFRPETTIELEGRIVLSSGPAGSIASFTPSYSFGALGTASPGAAAVPTGGSLVGFGTGSGSRYLGGYGLGSAADYAPGFTAQDYLGGYGLGITTDLFSPSGGTIGPAYGSTGLGGSAAGDVTSYDYGAVGGSGLGFSGLSGLSSFGTGAASTTGPGGAGSTGNPYGFGGSTGLSGTGYGTAAGFNSGSLVSPYGTNGVAGNLFGTTGTGAGLFGSTSAAGPFGSTLPSVGGNYYTNNGVPVATQGNILTDNGIPVVYGNVDTTSSSLTSASNPFYGNAGANGLGLYGSGTAGGFGSSSTPNPYGFSF